MKLTLRAARVNCGLTQDLVAQYLGYSRLAVQRWESGDVKPKAKVLKWLCDLYGVEEGDLIITQKDIIGHQNNCEERYNVRLL